MPAPPAEETKDINYDELYKLKFTTSFSYIRFSQTVEECTGCQYDMSSEDDVFLKAFNAKRPANAQCSEDDFEKIMEVFETTAARQTPFAAVDNTVVAFELMEIILKQEMDKKALPFAKDIYEYWRTRRQASGNKPLQPTLKFELHQDSDDGDPYVCFRRRDVRQTRKTRARDFQVTDKLKKLRLELEEGRRLVQAALQREELRRELLATDRKVFEMRAKLKDVRQQLGIKVDDEDLINQKVSNLLDFLRILANVLCSHRRSVYSRHHNCVPAQATQFAFHRGPTAVPLMLTLLSWRTKRLLETLRLSKRLRQRSCSTRNGTKTMWI